jgi:hypothetical protein
MSARATRIIDVVLGVWVVVWVVMGIRVWHEVKGLRALSDAVVTAGRAVEDTGTAVGALKGLPLVGDQIARLETRIHATARSAQQSGRASRQDIQNLSVLLGELGRRPCSTCHTMQRK